MQTIGSECVTSKHTDISEDISEDIEQEKVANYNSGLISLSTERGYTKGWKSFAKLLGLNTHNYMELAGLLIAGNLKLPKTTAIFNMGSATDCPSWALGLCQAKVGGKRVCYALKSETTMRPFVLPFRRRQEAYWKKVTAEEFVLSFLTYNALKPIAFTALRLNEAGDFWGQSCVDKAEKIARLLKPYGVKVYCYTARRDLDFSHVEVLKVSGSGWTNEHVRGEFRMILKKGDRPNGYGICPMDCKKCNRCTKGGMKTCIIRH